MHEQTTQTIDIPLNIVPDGCESVNVTTQSDEEGEVSFPSISLASLPGHLEAFARKGRRVVGITFERVNLTRAAATLRASRGYVGD